MSDLTLIKRLSGIGKGDSLDEVVLAKGSSQFRFRGGESILYTVLIGYKERYYFQINDQMFGKTFSTKELLIEQLKDALDKYGFKDTKGIDVGLSDFDFEEKEHIVNKYSNTVPLTSSLYESIIKESMALFKNDSSKIGIQMSTFLAELGKKGIQEVKQTTNAKTVSNFLDVIKKKLLVSIRDGKTSKEILNSLHTYQRWNILGHPDNLVSLDFSVGQTTTKLQRDLTKEELLYLVGNHDCSNISQVITSLPHPKIKERKGYISYFDGYYFLKESDGHRLEEYYSLFTPNDKISVFSTEYEDSKSLIRRLSFNQIDIGSFIYSLPAINLNPDYQRGEVWTLEDKQNLIKSIMEGRDIGKFTFYTYDREDHLKNNRYSKEVIDGKQRLSTIRDFITGQFQYKGKYYFEFTPQEVISFRQHMISMGELSGRNGKISKSDILKAFLLLNTAGKPVDVKVLENAQKMLDNEKSK